MNGKQRLSKWKEKKKSQGAKQVNAFLTPEGAGALESLRNKNPGASISAIVSQALESLDSQAAPASDTEERLARLEGLMAHLLKPRPDKNQTADPVGFDLPEERRKIVDRAIETIAGVYLESLDELKKGIVEGRPGSAPGVSLAGFKAGCAAAVVRKMRELKK